MKYGITFGRVNENPDSWTDKHFGINNAENDGHYTEDINDLFRTLERLVSSMHNFYFEPREYK